MPVLIPLQLSVTCLIPIYYYHQVALHTINAVLTSGNYYSGSSSSVSLLQSVLPAPTLITLASSYNPVLAFVPFSFLSLVSSSVSNTTAITGNISFYDNGVIIPACINITLVSTNIEVTCTTMYTGIANHTIEAVFISSNSNYLSSTSSELLQQIVCCSTAVQLTIILASTSTADEITWLASVNTFAVGTVTFFANNIAVTPCSYVGVVVGVANCTLPPYYFPLSGGSYVIQARYNGDNNFATNYSSIQQQIVTQVFTSTTTITSSSNPLMLSAPVTYYVYVDTNGGPTVTGSVTVYDDGIGISGCISVAVDHNG